MFIVLFNELKFESKIMADQNFGNGRVSLVNDYCFFLNIDKIKLYIHILHYIKQTWYFALGGGESCFIK